MTDQAGSVGYTEEQIPIQRVVREFGRKEVAPGAEEEKYERSAA